MAITVTGTGDILNNRLAPIGKLYTVGKFEEHCKRIKDGFNLFYFRNDIKNEDGGRIIGNVKDGKLKYFYSGNSFEIDINQIKGKITSSINLSDEKIGMIYLLFIAKIKKP